MLYQGSKTKIGPYIAKIIDHFEYESITEPFCGGLNMTRYLKRTKYCSDINPYLVAMWEKVLYKNWSGPPNWDEEFHKYVREHKTEFEPHIVGWIGFCSFGGKFFDSYRKDAVGDRNYQEEYRNAILLQKNQLYNVILKHGAYNDQHIRPGTLVYCDPPYEGTTQYISHFYHKHFYDWCRNTSKTNVVLISEYDMPKDFKVVWSMSRTSTLSSSATLHQEKLYIHESLYKGYLG